MTICIRYASEEWSDGAGAQIQRIAAVYSISQEFKLNYLSSKIKHIESNPGDGFTSLEDKQEFISRLNQIFATELENCGHKHSEKSLKYNRALKFRVSAHFYFLCLKILTRIRNQHILYRCENPYPIIEQYPDIYRHFTRKFGLLSRNKSQKIDVQLHVRGSKNGNELMNSRHVDIRWYIDIMRILASALNELKLEYSVTIHTDAPRAQTNWRPLDISADTELFWKSAHVMDSRRQINLQPIDFQSEFHFVDDLNVVREVDPIIAWNLMASADVLLTGRSSFSFVGALMNVSGLKLVPEFKHKYPSGWIVEKTQSPSGDSIRNKIYDFLKSVKVRRS